MKLPNFSNLTKKCKKLSSNLNLDEKLSKISNVIEEKYTEVSDSINLDEKISKVSDALGLDTKLMDLSNPLDSFGKKCTGVSETPKPEERQPETFKILNASSSNSRTMEVANKAIDLTKEVTKVHKNCITCKKYFVKGKNPATNRFKTTQVVVESTASMETVQQKSGFLPPFEITEVSLGAPTERQVAYAKKLKISLPQDAAFEDVSIFLTRYEEGKTLYPSPMPEKLIRYLIGKGIYVPAYASEDEAHNLYFRNIGLDEKIAYFAMKVYCNLKRKVYYTLEDTEPEMRDLFYLFAMKYKDNKEFIKSLSYYSGSDLPLGHYAISKKLKAYDMAVDFFITINEQI